MSTHFSSGNSADPDSKPATTAGGATDLAANRSPTASACEPHRELIVEALSRGRNARAIWHDSVDDHGFGARYASVLRFVARVRGAQVPEARVVITTAPGEECHVDYGDEPMVRDVGTGKYRRTGLFAQTLGYSRKSVRLIVPNSSTRLGGASRASLSPTRRGAADCGPRQFARGRADAGGIRPDSESALSRCARPLWRRGAVLPRPSDLSVQVPRAYRD